MKCYLILQNPGFRAFTAFELRENQQGVKILPSPIQITRLGSKG